MSPPKCFSAQRFDAVPRLSDSQVLALDAFDAADTVADVVARHAELRRTIRRVQMAPPHPMLSYSFCGSTSHSSLVT